MPGGEDKLRTELHRLGHPGDPEGAFEAISSKKARRRALRRLQVAALAVTVVAGTAGGVFALSRVFTATRPSHVASPTARNGLIAYAAENGRGRSWSIFVAGPGLQRELVPDLFTSSVAWSPDGTRIAFTQGTAPGSGRDVLVRELADRTGRQARVVFTRQESKTVAWSPDGRSLVLGLADGRLLVLKLGLSEGSFKLLPHSAGCFDGSPVWGPGSRIYFSRVCQDPKGSGIFVEGSGGTPAPRLVSVAGPYGQLALSPDGSTLAFIRVVNENGELWTVRTDGSDLNQVLPCPESKQGRSPGCTGQGSVAWSPDGSKLAFVATSGNILYEVAPDGANLRETGVKGVQCCLSWQPVPAGASHLGPTPSETPSESPSESPPISPSVGGTPPDIGFPCGGSSAVADFDGDGKLDIAIVAPTGARFFKPPAPCPSFITPPTPPPMSLTVAWGDGAQGTWPLPECQRACAAFASADVDGNGTAEFFLDIDEGASTVYLNVLELLPSEHAPDPLPVAPPGNGEFPAGQPLRLITAGSVRNPNFVTCDTSVTPPQLIETEDALSQDNTTWTVHETAFTFDGTAFSVVSAKDQTVPADPNDPQPPAPRGQPCWTDSNKA